MNGFRNTPLFWLLIAGLFGWLVFELLVSGDLRIDKRGTLHVTRAAQPAAYWLITLVAGTLAALAAHKAWRLFRERAR